MMGQKEAEQFFKAHLKSSAPELYPVWFQQYGKWMIVKDAPHSMAGFTDRHPVTGKPVIVELILQDADHNMMPLDMRTITLIRELLWEKAHAANIRQLLDRKDMRERDKVKAAQKLRMAMQWDFLKKANRFLKKETFVMPGKELPGKNGNRSPMIPAQA